ncbi:MAG: phosphatase PAP2 family protein [Cytophagaceae bacterium]
MISQTIKGIRFFLIPSLIYFIIGSMLLLFIPKGELTLFINKYHNFFLDNFFIAMTWVGEIYVVIAIIIFILLFHKIYYGLAAGGIMIFAGLLAQGLKRLVFSDFMRPLAFFEEAKGLYLIDGLDIHTMYSFPSGHTTGAFALFTTLSLIHLNKNRQFFFFFIAFLVGLSRIYLVQHFFMDTYFGTLLGISTAVCCFIVIKRYFPLNPNSTFNKPLIRLISNNENTAPIR